MTFVGGSASAIESRNSFQISKGNAEFVFFFLWNSNWIIEKQINDRPGKNSKGVAGWLTEPPLPRQDHADRFFVRFFNHFLILKMKLNITSSAKTKLIQSTVKIFIWKWWKWVVIPTYYIMCVCYVIDCPHLLSTSRSTCVIVLIISYSIQWI